MAVKESPSITAKTVATCCIGRGESTRLTAILLAGVQRGNRNDRQLYRVSRQLRHRHHHFRHQQAEFADLERIPQEWKHLSVIEDSNPQVKRNGRSNLRRRWRVIS